jgi:hypothetical protein
MERGRRDSEVNMSEGTLGSQVGRLEAEIEALKAIDLARAKSRARFIAALAEIVKLNPTVGHLEHPATRIARSVLEAESEPPCEQCPEPANGPHHPECMYYCDDAWRKTGDGNL